MQKKLQFTVEWTKGHARAWKITMRWIQIPTPVFMPVWTKATLKWLVYEMLKDPKYIWDLPNINLILNNTYHLFLPPWQDIIAQHWGLHKYQNRDWLILTDSGGYQAFSLGTSKNTSRSWKPFSKIMDDCIKFRDIHDWTSHVFSPQWCIDIQSTMWSDIMMMLDVCSPPNISDKKFRSHMILTHKRAKEQYEYHQKNYVSMKWALFPIVQWWTNLDLRQSSIDYLAPFAFDWIAVWWVSVWEPYEEIQKVINFTWPNLPSNVPRYLMWIGNPKWLRYAIENWFDMFDCVLPTRLARHWTFFNNDDIEKIWKSKNKSSLCPLTQTCWCYTCKNFTKSYLYHLRKEKEMLSSTLLSLHNICYLHSLVNSIRNQILQ